MACPDCSDKGFVDLGSQGPYSLPGERYAPCWCPMGEKWQPIGRKTMTYDSRPETKEHIRRVGYFMAKAERNLFRRAFTHDWSKLDSPEVEAFDKVTPRLASLEYGSDEYRQSLEDIRPALEHHYAHNDHHPQHFENGVRGMSLMALLEMLCDWRAASERTKQRTDDPEKVKNFDEQSLRFNQERFGYSDELAEILLNTARELGMLEENDAA